MFLENKYKKCYFNIIENTISLKRCKIHYKDEGYISYENHHIIPRCMGGDNINNLVLLTPREHFICHLLLTKMTDDSIIRRKLLAAVVYFKGYNKRYQKRYINSRLYQIAREEYDEIRRNSYNRELDVNRRQKISETMKKKWQDPSYHDNHGFLKIGKEERVNRLKKAQENRLSKIKPNRAKRIPTYKDISIYKNDQFKIIKNNQFPAYEKYGWRRS